MSLFFLLKIGQNNLNQPKTTKDNPRGAIGVVRFLKGLPFVALPLCVNALRLVAVSVSAGGRSDESTKNNQKQPKSTKNNQGQNNQKQPKTT